MPTSLTIENNRHPLEVELMTNQLKSLYPDEVTISSTAVGKAVLSVPNKAWADSFVQVVHAISGCRVTIQK